MKQTANQLAHSYLALSVYTSASAALKCTDGQRTDTSCPVPLLLIVLPKEVRGHCTPEETLHAYEQCKPLSLYTSYPSWKHSSAALADWYRQKLAQGRKLLFHLLICPMPGEEVRWVEQCLHKFCCETASSTAGTYHYSQFPK
jgi:hypothetical protein